MTLAQFSYDQLSKALIAALVLAGALLLTPYLGIHLLGSSQSDTPQVQPQHTAPTRRTIPKRKPAQKNHQPSSDFSDIENLLQ